MKVYGSRPGACPSGYRPYSNISLPVMWTNGSSAYHGWIQVMTDGSVLYKYVKDDHSVAEPTSAFQPYGTAVWPI